MAQGPAALTRVKHRPAPPERAAVRPDTSICRDASRIQGRATCSLSLQSDHVSHRHHCSSLQCSQRRARCKSDCVETNLGDAAIFQATFRSPSLTSQSGSVCRVRELQFFPQYSHHHKAHAINTSELSDTNEATPARQRPRAGFLTTRTHFYRSLSTSITPRSSGAQTCSFCFQGPDSSFPTLSVSGGAPSSQLSGLRSEVSV